MVNAKMEIVQFNTVGTNVDITVRFDCDRAIESPRLAIVFTADGCYRRVPMLVSIDGNSVSASGTYDVSYAFYDDVPSDVAISFVFGDGTDLGKRYETDIVVHNIKRNRIKHFFDLTNREKVKSLVGIFLNILSLPFRLLNIRKNRVSFITGRTLEPTGNLRAVYNTVKNMENVDTRLYCHKGGVKGAVFSIFKFLYLYMTSAVVYVDDYYHPISYVKKKKGVTLIQLWHGCGAFKTFGFSRYHKESVLEFYSPNHRQYDIAIVSSPDVIDFYAEAFGINNDNVKPLGSPRCDALVDEVFKASFRESFYDKYPKLKDKKILLFAPTFRGGGNGACYYPMEQFDVDRVLSNLGDDWAVVIKLHPYLTEKFTCSSENADRMVDCSEYDVNDILIVSDFLVTDYSSVIFEASILNVPMAFLTYDLEEFIETRDFYFDFKSFIPGPIARNVDDLCDLIKRGGDPNAVEEFKQMAFGDSLGTACDNMRKLTNDLLNA